MLRSPASRPAGATRPTPCRCACAPSSWHVPPSAFSGATPERAAARQLCRLLTHAAAFVVLDQLEAVAGAVTPPEDDEGGSSTAEAAARLAADKEALQLHLQSERLTDADAWLETLSARAPRVALRVAETRLAYASTGFEFGNLKRLAVEELSAGNSAVRTAWLRGAVEAGSSPQPAQPAAAATGQPLCAICLGVGSKPCGQCGGAGVNAVERFGSPAGAPCWLCEGSRRVPCGSCAASADAG